MEATLTQVEPILIYEEKQAIDQLSQMAEANRATLNAITSLALELRTEESILSASGSKAKEWVLEKYFSVNPKAREMAQFAKGLEFVIPEDMVRLQQLLESVNVKTFKFTEYDKRQKQWVLDSEDFENACARYRKYARTPEEIKRRKFQEQYYNWIMNELKPGEIAMRKFCWDNELLTHNGRGVVMNPRFPFESYKF